MTWLSTALAMIGKMCITASFGIAYVYSAELYPTIVRSAGMGTSSLFARAAAALAPFINQQLVWLFSTFLTPQYFFTINMKRQYGPCACHFYLGLIF